MKKRILPFTALELVLVCGVIAILLSISLPAFYNISSGKQLTRAASEVAGKITLTRARAVSDHIYAALVFYEDSTRIAQVYKDGSVYKFARWMPDDAWEPFGEGIVIRTPDKNFGIYDSSAHGAKTSVSMTTVKKEEIDMSSITDAGQPTRSIIFSPSGRIVMPSAYTTTPVVIRFVEGVLSPVEVIKKDSDGKATYAVFTVNPLSGRSEIKEYYDEAL